MKFTCNENVSTSVNEFQDDGPDILQEVSQLMQMEWYEEERFWAAYALPTQDEVFFPVLMRNGHILHKLMKLTA